MSELKIYEFSETSGKWAKHSDAMAEINSQQAKIDELMLEYCPDDMTEEQMKAYEEAQVSVETEWLDIPDFLRTNKD